ncbi:MAG: HD domain-containing protein [Ruminococcaceae bacterium]|nr:HD domain-containing protein [Oscillospiraceae bacterium]
MSDNKDKITEKILTEDDIADLSEKIRPYLTGKRYEHTLSVEREAVKLGELYLPERINDLRAAALLHDITKREDIKKQLQYCEEFGIMISAEEIASPAVFHSKTAAEVARRDFSEYVNDDIVSGIRWHTTGRENMSIFDAIIYLSDFIEETRDFDDCVKLRRYFWDKISAGEDKLDVLTDTMIYSFDLTIGLLINDGAVIDENTVKARNYYLVTRLKKNVKS